MARFYRIWVGPEFEKRKDPYVKVEFDRRQGSGYTLELQKSRWVEFCLSLAEILGISVEVDDSYLPGEDDED